MGDEMDAKHDLLDAMFGATGLIGSCVWTSFGQ
jgi:hypothetical protein